MMDAMRLHEWPSSRVDAGERVGVVMVSYTPLP